MGKYNVTFKCGHEQEVELFGKMTEREKRIKYYEESCLCNECKQKMIAASRVKDDEAKGIKTPEILSRGYWNGKIYGKGAIKSIYLNGDKVELTAEQLESLEEYLKAKEVE